ncbi:MAG: ABC transporter ATP-binding protein [Candidatus Bipolaricaulota bacterium]|nr:ABC transporter ATP-binding protein [Candidatus Bipolaricaulota bacterium]
MNVLHVENLYVGYYKDINILQGISLGAEKGCLTSVIGTNGVGKSTLLKTIYGFLTPNKGKLFYQGNDIAGANPYKMPTLGLTYIPQRRNVFPEMTVEENLQLGAWTFRREKKRIKLKLKENYERFPILKERRKQKAGNFSGGEQRMVELGRAMMIDPQLMLVDEPTAGLAPKLAREIYDKLLELKDEGMTILMVDQNIRQAIEISDYVYALALGKNMAEGPREDFDNLKERIKEWL